MKHLLLSSILLTVVLLGCKKPMEETDWRTPYTGTFDFTCYWTEMVLTSNGMEERIIDTGYLCSTVETLDTNRMKIRFGEGVIGINYDPYDVNYKDTLKMTVTPIIEKNGVFVFPKEEYPSAGLCRFQGGYSGTDTIHIYIQYSYMLGGYEKYQVVGIRKE